MMMDAQDLNRLKKLLALGDSANEGERHNAIAAAGALLKRHGKSMVDLSEILQQDSISSMPEPDWLRRGKEDLRRHQETAAHRGNGAPEPKPAKDGVLIAPEQRAKLLANFEASRKAGWRLDHKPVVKLVGKYLGEVWLTEK
jgi:hypothetical protein